MKGEGITKSSYLKELSSLPSSLLSDYITNEFQAIEQQQQTSIKKETLPYIQEFIQKYEKLETPSSISPNISTLEQAIQHNKQSIEYQTLTSLNIELLSTYGIETWKNQVQLLDNEYKLLQQQNEQLLKNINNINHLRQSSQSVISTKLSALQRKYSELNESNFFTELACEDMEKEIKRLRKIKE